jgi:hypothetical protein
LYEIQDKTALPVAPEEEIIEKKPVHPVEIYADAARYNTGEKASDEYLKFAREHKIQMQKVNKETTGLDELKSK